MESEAISLQILNTEELSAINSEDHKKQNALKQITTQLQILKNTPSKRSIFSQEFISE